MYEKEKISYNPEGSTWNSYFLESEFLAQVQQFKAEEVRFYHLVKNKIIFNPSVHLHLVFTLLPGSDKIKIILVELVFSSVHILSL